MIRKILFASAATAAIAVAATPATAQEACVTNPGAVTSGTSTGSQSLACGAGSNDAGSFHTTVIGNTAVAQAGSVNDVTAIGYATTAGSGDTVIGAHSTATNLASFGDTVVGSNSTATGTNSTVLGALSNDGGFTNSVALGYATTATANNQVAVGGRTISGVTAGTVSAASTEAVNGAQLFATNSATTANTTAITALQAESAYIAINSTGAPATATGTNAIAIGQGATASGTDSIAIGNGANNGGFANSVALGGFTNTAANQVRVGGTTAATARIVTGVAAGTISSTSVDAVNGSQLNASNNRITALETMGTGFAADIADLNDRVDNVYRRGRAGTAVAIAMSGNGFLPDKKINVTGNVGFYSGAYAAALQVGAILTDTVAFNAGVAKGLNDGGKMGARMGFTLGW